MQAGITQLEERKQAAIKAMQAITRMLGMTEEQYADMKYSYGLLYIETYIPNDAEARRHLESSKIFWNWWKNHWLLRDETFLVYAKDLYKMDRKAAYNQLHNPLMLAAGWSLHGVALDASYANMIGIINKETAGKTKQMANNKAE